MRKGMFKKDATQTGQQTNTPSVGETVESGAGIYGMLIMTKDITKTGMMMMTAVHLVCAMVTHQLLQMTSLMIWTLMMMHSLVMLKGVRRIQC